MGNSDISTSQIGRYQIASSATDSDHVLAVLDTATGEVWVKRIYVHAVRGDHRLLDTENQGKAFWEV